MSLFNLVTLNMWKGESVSFDRIDAAGDLLADLALAAVLLKES